MKAKLEFNLPEEKSEFDYAVSGMDAHIVIDRMFEELRKVWKYSEDENSTNHAMKWRDILSELCNDYNINRDL